VVEGILRKLEATFKKKPLKGTLADYIRLVQLRQELGDEEPREIRVTWVEPGGEQGTGPERKSGSEV
jgi:hypothetical protein